MYPTSSITEINDLYSWFEKSNKHGYWSIYRGLDKKPGERVASGIYEEPESGWQALSNQLLIQTKGGGVFTVYLSNSEKDSSGYTTRYSTVSGFSAINGINQSGINSSEHIDSIAEKLANQKIAEFQKQQEIEALKADIELIKKNKKSKGISGVFADIGEILEENPTFANILTPIIHGIAARFLGNFNTSPASINGIPPDTITTQAAEYDELITESNIQDILFILTTFKNHFGDYVGTLNKLSQWINANPDQAKLILNQLS